MRNDINTDILENCCRIMRHHVTRDMAVIEELLNPNFNCCTCLVEPFKKELNKNMLNTVSPASKRDIISHYIFEFWELQRFFQEFENILFEGTISHYTEEGKCVSHTTKSGFTKKLDKVETYAVECHELFKLLFREIQFCCIKFDVDFMALCEVLKFNPDIFDDGITRAFKKPSTKRKPTIVKETELTFDKLLTPAKAEFIMELLEEMSITVNGKSQLSTRKKGALLGIVEALKEKAILPPMSINALCSIVADKIGLELKSKLDCTNISNSFQKKAKRYITEHYKG